VTKMIRPCGCAGVTTSAPDEEIQIVAWSKICDHGPSAWESISDLTGGKRTVLGLVEYVDFIIGVLNTAVERGYDATHVRVWMGIYSEPRSDTDCMVGVRYNRNRLELVWDPCVTQPEVFHGSIVLLDWAIRQLKNEVNVIPLN